VQNEDSSAPCLRYVKDSTTELKDYCNKTLNGLRANIPQQEVEPLIKVRKGPKSILAHPSKDSSNLGANIHMWVDAGIIHDALGVASIRAVLKRAFGVCADQGAPEGH
jgi:hypothetical protein